MSVRVSVFAVGLFLQVQNIPPTMVTISKGGSPQCNDNDSTTNNNKNCLTGDELMLNVLRCHLPKHGSIKSTYVRCMHV